MSKKPKLGDKCKDKVTGFIGIVVCQHNYLDGCARYSLQPPVDKDGKVPDQHTFDEPQLEVLEKEKAKKGKTDIGGPERHMDMNR